MATTATPAKSKVAVFRLSTVDLKRLEQIARRFEMNKSQTLRTLLRLYVTSWMGNDP